MRTVLASSTLLAGIVFLAPSCADQDEATLQHELTAPAPPVRRLVPPVPFVLAPDGTTKQSLEQAGILRPDGRQSALVLGKALFWDQQAGSDGNACASCHQSAGADLRIRNQLSPGFNDVASGPGGDPTFGSVESDTGEVAAGAMPSGAWAEANYTLTPADFPLHQLEDKRDRNSRIRSTTNDAVSSQGSFDHDFTKTRPMGRPDRCILAHDGVFHVGNLAERQVEPRNTPTTINAAFFNTNFWDGRANNTFNGVGVFGMRDIQGDPNKRLVVVENGVARLDYLRIKNASLASQAVGPPVSALEMSCAGRSFPDVARKLLMTIPLFHQQVDCTDSVLGPYASASGRGLKPQYAYALLIARSFDPKYWASWGRYRIVNGQLVPDPTGYTQMELNFSMFWGVSIMLYEQTLISDQSRFDDWFASCRPAVTNPDGPGSQAVPIANPIVTCRPATENPNQSTDPTAHGFTAQEALGFGLFNNGGIGIRNPGNPACSGCHPVTNPVATPFVFPTFSEAAFQEGQSFVPVERSRIDDPGFPQPSAVAGGSHDRGFFSLGLRPASTDLGNGGTDPYGNPLSAARMFLREQAGLAVPDPTGITDRCNTPTLIEPGGTPPYRGCPSTTPPLLDLALAQERELVDGGFKTPSIRNVGLTPPYFHYGGYSTLRSVVELYARGGSKRHQELAVPGATGDWSGTGPLGQDSTPPAGPDFGTNVDFFIRDIKSTNEQIDALVAFLLTVTDPRVQCDQAPFDHPELTVQNGHSDADHNHDGMADDRSFVLPKVGASGYAGANARFCIPNSGDLFAPGMGARRGD
ncbi:MAG: Methylamine utilization protein mauG [Deltaproteobacteria bacterium]|nr:Methylamine utilization protein mauG [Deltaproteobacteria bacterium]